MKQLLFTDQDFLSLFLGNTHELDNNQRIKIFKEILQWKNGLLEWAG